MSSIKTRWLRTFAIFAACAAAHPAAFAEEKIPGLIVGLEATAASIRNSDGLASLPEAQRRQLAERFAAYFEVRNEPDSDAYIALMQSWGGRWRIEPNSDLIRDRLVTGWHPAGTACAIRSVDADGVRCELVPSAVEPDGRIAPWSMPALARGAMGCGYLCVFDFGPAGSFELAAAGQQVAQIMIPTVEQNDGARLFMGVRFVWEPESRNWVPWEVHCIGEPGKYLCTQLF